ncbi:hypothetical protein [Ferrimonas pelagia]|uniref:Protein BatD n=1 Tax=Ferrimonas pelagia TaxID=1177826 RepID=A0ABP9ELM7_9GAMM
MANPIPLSKVLSSVLLLLMLLSTASTAAPLIPVEISPAQITPGQQIQLRFTVQYADEADAEFTAPPRNEWGPLQLVETQAYPARWDQGVWRQEFELQLLVPEAGDYALPRLWVEIVEGEQRQRQQLAPAQIHVASSFEQDAQEQPLMRMQGEIPSEGALPKGLLAAILLGAGLLITLAVLQRARRRSAATVAEITPPTPADLARQCQADQTPQWEALRQWMQAQTGQDPLALAPDSAAALPAAHIELLQRYQQARFAAPRPNNNAPEPRPAAFIRLCQACEARLS